MSTHGNCIVHVPRRFVANEWGGTETVILEIARQQQLAGYKSRVETSMALADSRSEMIGGVPVLRHSYCYPFLGLSANDCNSMDKKGGNLLSLPLFWSLLRSKDVRLFHAHALKRLGGAVRTAARMRRKPFVVSLHGGVFDVPAAELADMTAPIEGKMEWGKAFGALFGSRRILDDADYVICVGQSEYEAAKKSLSHERISYLPNGVDTARFAKGNGTGFRVKNQIPEDAFVVLNISRIDAQKNQLLLIESFARLRAERPDAVLVLIGPETQPDYAAKVRTKIAALGLSRAVRMLPGMSGTNPQLVDAYHACDVFALASRHEPFGIVVLEAWSAGKPVVVSDVGGLKALVDEAETGFKVDTTGDAASERFAARLSQLAGDPVLRRKVGDRGLVNALTNYDWACVNNQLEMIYRRAEAFAARRK
jgi:glycosyltransferase involved in cell wall biosynthesis